MKIILIILLILFKIFPLQASKLSDKNDSLFLVKFYYALNGPYWDDKASWLSEEYTIDLWGSIEAKYLVQGEDTTVYVKGIYIPLNNLRGKMPDTIPLPYLENFYITDNKGVTGNVPYFVSKNMKKINLMNLSLDGSIPDLSNLPSLKNLRLMANNLSGELNGKIPISVEHLTLHGNKFSGIVPALNLPNLVGIDLSHNNFEGDFPSINAPKLKFFHIFNNEFVSIPDLKSFTEIELISVQDNKLTFAYLESAILSAKVDFSYDGQDTVPPLELMNDGDNAILEVIINGEYNLYQWYKNGEAIDGAIEKTYTASVPGNYHCEIKNEIAVEQTFFSDTVNVNINSVDDEDANEFSVNAISMGFPGGVKLIIESPSAARGTLKIFSLAGNKVFSGEIILQPGRNEYSASYSFQSGIFYYLFSSGKKVNYGTFISIN